MIDDATVTFTGSKYDGWKPTEELLPLIRADLQGATVRGEFPPGVTVSAADRLLPAPQAVVVTVHGLPSEMADTPVDQWIEAAAGPADNPVPDIAGVISKYVNAYNEIEIALYGPERDEDFRLVIELARSERADTEG